MQFAIPEGWLLNDEYASTVTERRLEVFPSRVGIG